MSQPTSKEIEYPHLLRLVHWIASVSFVILFLTGLTLHAASRPDWSVFSGVVPPWLWRGRVYVWHYWAAVAFFPALLISLAFLWQRRSWVRPTHIILVVGGLFAACSGLWMMFPFGPFNVFKVIVGVHAALGLIVLPIGFIWHTIEGLTKYLKFLVPVFRPLKNPQWGQAALFIPVALLTTWIMFEGWPLQPPWRNLAVARIAPGQQVGDDLATLPWNDAEPLTVRLVNGSGFYSGQTTLILKALHDGSELYVRGEWADPTENYDYWPWKKTKDGWEYLQTSSKDETVHYEDKFSLVFPITSSWHFDRVGCAIYCHVDGKYGWGYKGGQPDIDVWHWKSARTDPTGQVDDKYWSLPDFEAKDVGRFGDPKTGGGYTKNASEDGTRPLFLPDDLAADYHGSIPTKRSVEYSDEASEKIKPETMIPGVVNAAFVGDRGDVTCRSEHRNDRWTLFIRRKLDTGSEHDVQLVPGGSYTFGCAAFDHAAKRHGYSMPVFRLVLEK